MEQHSIEIDVKGADPAISGVFAKEIANILRGIEGVDEVALRKADQTDLDLGSIVVAIVTSAAVTVLAQGFADWVRQHDQVVLVTNGTMIKGDAKAIERILFSSISKEERK